MMWLFVSTAVQ